MANVVHPPIDFHHGPVSPNLGFGFGMSSPASKLGGWQHQHAITLGHNNPAAFQQLASTMSQSSPNRPQKRRHDPEDEDTGVLHESSLATTSRSRDDAMDRSPTPERPKKGPPKRARVMNVVETRSKDKSKENKPPEDGDDGNVDVGVLLGEYRLHLIERPRTDNRLSELAATISIATVDFSIECPAFIEIRHSTTDTTTNPGNSRPSHGTFCQETTRCVPLL